MSDKDNTYINYAEPPARTGEKGIREKVKALAIKVKAAVEKGAETLSELKKISGAVLLSHSRNYSTIAAGVLNYRVREGNVCCYPAMSTGKKTQ